MKTPSKGAPDSNPKTRHGLAKPSMSVVPPVAVLHMIGALQVGEGRYGAFNWRRDAISETTYYDAAMRHLMAWFDGEDIAEDSGVHHLGHVMACCAILLDADSMGTLNSNRPLPGKFPVICAEMTAKLD